MNETDLTTERKLELIRDITALADSVTHEYVKGLAEIVKSPHADEHEKRRAFKEMDRVLRISKQYSDRVLLAEGKTTANIGVAGSDGMPFNVTFTKTYETKQSDDETAGNDE